MTLLSTNLNWWNLIGFHQRWPHNSLVAKVNEFPPIFRWPLSWSFNKSQGLQHGRENSYIRSIPHGNDYYRWSFSLGISGFVQRLFLFFSLLRSGPLQNMVKSGQHNSLGCPGWWSERSKHFMSLCCQRKFSDMT